MANTDVDDEKLDLLGLFWKRIKNHKATSAYDLSKLTAKTETVKKLFDDFIKHLEDEEDGFVRPAKGKCHTVKDKTKRNQIRNGIETIVSNEEELKKFLKSTGHLHLIPSSIVKEPVNNAPHTSTRAQKKNSNSAASSSDVNQEDDKARKKKSLTEEQARALRPLDDAPKFLVEKEAVVNACITATSSRLTKNDSSLAMKCRSTNLANFDDAEFRKQQGSRADEEFGTKTTGSVLFDVEDDHEDDGDDLYVIKLKSNMDQDTNSEVENEKPKLFTYDELLLKIQEAKVSYESGDRKSADSLRVMLTQEELRSEQIITNNQDYKKSLEERIVKMEEDFVIMVKEKEEKVCNLQQQIKDLEVEEEQLKDYGATLHDLKTFLHTASKKWIKNSEQDQTRKSSMNKEKLLSEVKELFASPVKQIKRKSSDNNVDDTKENNDDTKENDEVQLLKKKKLDNEDGGDIVQ